MPPRVRVLVVGRFAFPFAHLPKKCDILCLSVLMAFGHGFLSLLAFAGHWQFVLAFPLVTKLSKIRLGVSAIISPFSYDHFAPSGTLFHGCVRFLAFRFPFLFLKTPLRSGAARALVHYVTSATR